MLWARLRPACCCGLACTPHAAVGSLAPRMMLWACLWCLPLPRVQPCPGISQRFPQLPTISSAHPQAMRAKAKRALLRFTGAAIDTLRDDDEEFLQGALCSLLLGAL